MTNGAHAMVLRCFLMDQGDLHLDIVGPGLVMIMDDLREMLVVDGLRGNWVLKVIVRWLLMFKDAIHLLLFFIVVSVFNHVGGVDLLRRMRPSVDRHVMVSVDWPLRHLLTVMVWVVHGRIVLTLRLLPVSVASQLRLRVVTVLLFCGRVCFCGGGFLLNYIDGRKDGLKVEATVRRDRPMIVRRPPKQVAQRAADVVGGVCHSEHQGGSEQSLSSLLHHHHLVAYLISTLDRRANQTLLESFL